MQREWYTNEAISGREGGELKGGMLELEGASDDATRMGKDSVGKRGYHCSGRRDCGDVERAVKSSLEIMGAGIGVGSAA